MKWPENQHQWASWDSHKDKEWHPLKSTRKKQPGQLVSHGGRWQHSHLQSGLRFLLLDSSSVFSVRLLSEFLSGDHPHLNWLGNLLVGFQEVFELGSFTLTIWKEQEPWGYRFPHKEKGSLCCFQVLYFSQALYPRPQSLQSPPPYGFSVFGSGEQWSPAYEKLLPPEMFPKV